MTRGANSAIATCCRWTTAAIVTNPFHQFRALRVFQCAARSVLGAEHLVFALAEVPRDSAAQGQTAVDVIFQQWDVWREVAAIVYYWFMGWLC